MKHDPEKWESVFGKDHAQANKVRDDPQSPSHDTLAAESGKNCRIVFPRDDPEFEPSRASGLIFPLAPEMPAGRGGEIAPASRRFVPHSLDTVIDLPQGAGSERCRRRYCRISSSPSVTPARLFRRLRIVAAPWTPAPHHQPKMKPPSAKSTPSPVAGIAGR